MATRQDTVDFLLEQLASVGAVSARKMFGEYGLYLAGQMFGLVCDDQLFLKPTHAGRAHAEDLAEGVPYPGAKPCLLVPGDRWDDGDWLAEMVRITAAALPQATSKRAKPKNESSRQDD